MSRGQPHRRAFLKTAAELAGVAAFTPCGRRFLAAADSAGGEPFFLTRGVVLGTEELRTLDWPRGAKAAGLTTVGTHIFPHEVAEYLATDSGQVFLESCRVQGIQVEHELHAMSDLLPRALFDRDPAMFRMDEQGQRVREFNLCVHSKNALDVVCENAMKYARLLRPTTGRFFFWIDDGKPMCRCKQCRGLSDGDQALILENRMVAALRQIDPHATLAHLAYHKTLTPPTQIKPEQGIFLEFALIKRAYDRPLAAQSAVLDALDANLAFFGREGAQALEYWLDLSMFSNWKRENIEKLPWREEFFWADLKTYAERGIRHVTSFAVYLDGDYAKKFGDPPINSYGAGMLRWQLVGGRAVESKLPAR